ncbi:MAG: hypothetical protein GXY89_04805 [Tissierellia bacterium]|nr:hypothetical protein [Tissierellia bacterium]
MAKFIRDFKGNFNEVIEFSKNVILDSSMSSSLEDEVFYNVNNVKIGVMVFERYSITGGNRLSLTLTVVGFEDEIEITAITSGGSQGIFFKINTIGEEEFLTEYAKKLVKYIEN